ncbi:hypothetical protein Tco_0582067 [Tanacetum coccineum]
MINKDDTLNSRFNYQHRQATDQNLKGLVTVGQMLIEKPVSRVNFDTGVFEALPDGGTNCEALKKFAKELLDEQKQWECLI